MMRLRWKSRLCSDEAADLVSRAAGQVEAM